MGNIKDSEIYKEYLKVRDELSAIGEPLRKRERELSRQVEEMYRAARKEKFESIQGKLFYYEIWVEWYLQYWHLNGHIVIVPVL